MNLKIGFIGAGNMAEAIIKGLTTGQERPEIRVTNRSNQERLKALADQYGVIPARRDDLIEKAQMIILAAKPKDIKGILQSLTPDQVKDKLIVSLAAGIPLALMQSCLPQTALVRAMPNTSSAVLHSMTGLVRGDYVNEEQVEWVEWVFSRIGKCLWIKEQEMNPLIAISGSAPAYYYLLTEYLIEAGVQLGLSRETAETLARETVIGAGKMLDQSSLSPARLRENITSPNGTTFAALEAFRQGGLEDLVRRATKACAGRAEEIEREYGQ